MHLTLKAPRKILEEVTIYFCFLFFRENNAWHCMWIVCPADDSHVMSSIISSENYVEHALKMLSASHDWRFKGYKCSFDDTGNNYSLLSLSAVKNSFRKCHRYSEILLLRPPEIKTSYLLKTLFAKFRLFFSSLSTPSAPLIKDHIWNCPKVVFDHFWTVPKVVLI